MWIKCQAESDCRDKLWNSTWCITKERSFAPTRASQRPSRIFHEENEREKKIWNDKLASHDRREQMKVGRSPLQNKSQIRVN